MENKEKIILDLCGGTGAWSRLYKDAGYDVRVITLPEYDVCTYEPPENVYGILAAPPCTEFSIAKNGSHRRRDLETGMITVEACLKIIWKCRLAGSLKFWALENPVGYLRQFLGKPHFTFYQWWFGDIEVVRCKDCKYAELDDELYLCHHNGADWNSGEHFCSYGKRKEKP